MVRLHHGHLNPAATHLLRRVEAKGDESPAGANGHRDRSTTENLHQVLTVARTAEFFLKRHGTLNPLYRKDTEPCNETTHNVVKVAALYVSAKSEERGGRWATPIPGYRILPGFRMTGTK